jgi:hypothetical protein
MLIPPRSQVRHDFLIRPATDADAAALLIARVEALAGAVAADGDEGAPIPNFVRRIRYMGAWVNDDAAFGSLIYDGGTSGFVLDMFSDHPDHPNEAFDLDASEVADYLNERRDSARSSHKAPRPIAEVRAESIRTTELAERWGVKRETIAYLMDGGHIGSFRFGRFHYVRRQEVLRFEQANGLRQLLAEGSCDPKRMTFVLNTIATRLRAQARTTPSAA